MDDKMAGEIAQAFADALDRDDFSAAERLLAEDCVYKLASETLSGRGTVIDTYRRTADRVRVTFDGVSYRSKVVAVEQRVAIVQFEDNLRVGERRHTFRCHQHLLIGEQGGIAAIRHEELNGERDRLKEFLSACDIEW